MVKLIKWNQNTNAASARKTWWPSTPQRDTADGAARSRTTLPRQRRIVNSIYAESVERRSIAMPAKGISGYVLTRADANASLAVCVSFTSADRWLRRFTGRERKKSAAQIAHCDAFITGILMHQRSASPAESIECWRWRINQSMFGSARGEPEQTAYGQRWFGCSAQRVMH